VRQIHLNRSRASRPTLISMTQRTRFVRDLNALHHPLIETRDRLLSLAAPFAEFQEPGFPWFHGVLPCL
jgi:hypothetical protein